MNRQEMKKELKRIIPKMEMTEGIDGGHYNSVYLDSFMNLDPCGRYHCAISPNGATNKCEKYWDNLNAVAGELGGWIEGGEGDPTDIFFCIQTEKQKAMDW